MGVGYLHRRGGGIYVVRVVVPVRHRVAIGRTEIHASSGHRTIQAATLAGLDVVLTWTDLRCRVVQNRGASLQTRRDESISTDRINAALCSELEVWLVGLEGEGLQAETHSKASRNAGT
jgi:hypothetical protein